MVIYDGELEELLKSHAEQSESLSILHRYCFEFFNFISNASNAFVIVLSAGVGFAQAVSIDWPHTNLILGLLSLVIGLVKSLETYFATSRMASEHKIVYLSYKKIQKNLTVQLSLHREDRRPPEELLAIIQDNLIQLEESSPPLLPYSLKRFRKKYGEPQGISLPAVLNGLTQVKINRPLNVVGDIIHIDNIP